jgi:class 3 adenylate cyclase
MLMNYTAIGNTVNTAKRIEEICEPDQILISGDTYSLIKCEEFELQNVLMRSQGRRTLKGRSIGMEVYAVEDVAVQAAAA